MAHGDAFDEQNNTFLIETLAEIKKSHREAERKFEAAEREIERINSSVIDVYFDDPHSKIVQAVHTSMQASKELNFTCQALVISLDDLCRPRLTEEVSASVVFDIAREIKKLNEDSIINADYTGSLNGISFGDVAKVSFEPTIQARAIEMFWQTKAKEFEKIEADNLKKQQDREYIKKHNISADDIEKHKQYEQAKKLYEKAGTSAEISKAESQFCQIKGYLDSDKYLEKCKEKAALIKADEKVLEEKQKQEEEKKKAKEKAAKEKKEKEIDEIKAYAQECLDSVKDLSKQLKQAVADEKVRLTEETNAAILQAEEEKRKHQDALQSLGFFAFSQRKEERSAIEVLDEKIAFLSSPDYITSRIEAYNKAAQEMVKNYEREVKEFLNRKYSIEYKGFPPKYEVSKQKATKKRTRQEAEKILASNPRPINADSIKHGTVCDAIFEYLYFENKKMTLNEIMEGSPVFSSIPDLSSSYASCIVMMLVKQKLVVRSEEGGRAYFAAVDFSEEQRKTMPPYELDKRYADLECPKKPDISKIFE